MGNRALAIVEDLKALYADRAGLKNDLNDLKERGKGIEAALVPEGGWPGKNETERALAKTSAMLNDQQYRDCNLETLGTERSLLDVEAVIDGLRDEMRMLEMIVRDNTNVVLGGASVFDLMTDATTDEVKDMLIAPATEDNGAGEWDVFEIDDDVIEKLTGAPDPDAPADPSQGDAPATDLHDPLVPF